MGGDILKTPVAAINEFRQDIVYRLHRQLKRTDFDVLADLWIRDRTDGEEVPSDTAWCNYYSIEDKVVSKQRIRELEPYIDEDIMSKSQGPKDCGREWV